MAQDSLAGRRTLLQDLCQSVHYGTVVQIVLLRERGGLRLIDDEPGYVFLRVIGSWLVSVFGLFILCFGQDLEYRIVSDKDWLCMILLHESSRVTDDLQCVHFESARLFDNHF